MRSPRKRIPDTNSVSNEDGSLSDLWDSVLRSIQYLDLSLVADVPKVLDDLILDSTVFERYQPWDVFHYEKLWFYTINNPDEMLVELVSVIVDESSPVVVFPEMVYLRASDK